MRGRIDRVEAGMRALYGDQYIDKHALTDPDLLAEKRHEMAMVLEAADAVEPDVRRLVIDWTEDGQGIVLDPQTNPMVVVGTHSEPMPDAMVARQA